MTRDLIDTVAFRGETLTLVWRAAEPYVAIRPICDRLGLDPKSQRRKLLDPASVFNWGHMTPVGQPEEAVSTPVPAPPRIIMMATTGADGKQREMVCLHAAFVGLWLSGITAAKVKPDIREALVAYQVECALVIFEHVKVRLLGERQAASEALVRLRADLIARKPLWVRLRDLAALGWDFERIWRAVGRPRHIVAGGLADLVRLGVLERAPQGAPAPAAPQLELFGAP